MLKFIVSVLLYWSVAFILILGLKNIGFFYDEVEVEYEVVDE